MAVAQRLTEGFCRQGRNPSVTPFGRATSPIVLRKNREDLHHPNSFMNAVAAWVSASCLLDPPAWASPTPLTDTDTVKLAA